MRLQISQRRAWESEVKVIIYYVEPITDGKMHANIIYNCSYSNSVTFGLLKNQILTLQINIHA